MSTGLSGTLGPWRVVGGWSCLSQDCLPRLEKQHLSDGPDTGHWLLTCDMVFDSFVHVGRSVSSLGTGQRVFFFSESPSAPESVEPAYGIQ